MVFPKHAEHKAPVFTIENSSYEYLSVTLKKLLTDLKKDRLVMIIHCICCCQNQIVGFDDPTCISSFILIIFMCFENITIFHFSPFT